MQTQSGSGQRMITLTFQQSEETAPLVEKLLKAETFMEFGRVLQLLLNAEDAMENTVESGSAHGKGIDPRLAFAFSEMAGYEDIGQLRKALRKRITVRDYLP